MASGEMAPKAPVRKRSGTSLIAPRAGKRLLAHSLRQALPRGFDIEKKRDDVILDFDPIAASQDPSGADLQIAEEEMEGETASVSVSFVQHGEKTRTMLRYALNRTGDAWRIDDIDGEFCGEKRSLRKILTNR